MTRKQAILKSIAIEAALEKMGWKIEINFSGCESSSSFYAVIEKWVGTFDENGIEDVGEWIVKKIRFSDHDLPAYYPAADYECRFDINSAAWKTLKPKLKKLFVELK